MKSSTSIHRERLLRDPSSIHLMRDEAGLGCSSVAGLAVLGGAGVASIAYGFGLPEGGERRFLWLVGAVLGFLPLGFLLRAVRARWQVGELRRLGYAWMQPRDVIVIEMVTGRSCVNLPPPEEMDCLPSPIPPPPEPVETSPKGAEPAPSTFEDPLWRLCVHLCFMPEPGTRPAPPRRRPRHPDGRPLPNDFGVERF